MNKQETLEEAAVIYAHKSFIWPSNKQGEKQSIPPGQVVPPGYAKHQKIATKHFTSGAKWQQENSNINALDFEIDSLKREIKVFKHQQEQDKNNYSEEEVLELVNNFEIHLGSAKVHEMMTFKKWFEQFKKK